MTTACCLEIGLSDNCFELTAMRRFRDKGLAHMPGGKSEIARYYDIAPRILQEIRRLGESHRLISFYVTHILPSVILAHLGFYRVTHALYNDLMRRLERRYLQVCHPHALTFCFAQSEEMPCHRKCRGAEKFSR
jgi:hypothetical protein